MKRSCQITMSTYVNFYLFVEGRCRLHLGLQKHGKTRIMPPLADHLPSHCCVLPSLQEIKNQHVTCTWSIFHGWIFRMDPFQGVSMIMISDIPNLFGGNYPHCQLGIHTNPANLLVAAGLPRQTSPTLALRQN